MQKKDPDKTEVPGDGPVESEPLATRAGKAGAGQSGIPEIAANGNRPRQQPGGTEWPTVPSELPTEPDVDSSENLAKQTPHGGSPSFETLFEDEYATQPDVDHREPLASTRAVEASALSDAGPLPKIEGYRLIRKLGQGGMGAVFLAEDLQLSREVAIKIVSQSFEESVTLRKRFEAEIQALAGLQHTYIAQLFSAGTFEGLPYFVMEYVGGPTLEQLAREPMKPETVASLVGKLCEAVDYCHQAGILHRDLKPSNVLMLQQDAVSHAGPPLAENQFDEFVPKIADFGLAKAIGTDVSNTRTGEILGTPGYMSPEQARGEIKSLTATCDVYALGAILYRLLTGRPPFAAAEPLQAVVQAVSEEPVRPRRLVAHVPIELETICLKCLEKVGTRRYASAADLRNDLQCYLDGRPITARPASWWEKSVKWSRRNPALTAVAASAVLMIVVTVAGLVWHNHVLAEELAKSKRLADHGSELSRWLISEHLAHLNSVPGTSQSRHNLVSRVQSYLDASLKDMPPDSKYTRRLGYSYAQLASVSGGDDQNNLGDLDSAEANYLKSVELYQQALQQGESPELILQFEIDNRLALAAVYREKQQPAASQAQLQLAEEKLRQLKPTTWNVIFLQVQLLEQQADNSMLDNNFEQALAKLDEVKQLVTNAPDDADVNEIENQRIYLASTRSRCLEFLGRLEEAEQSYEQTLRLAQASLQREPNNALVQRRYASTLVQHADIIFDGHVEQALVQYRQALQIVKTLREQDSVSVELAFDVAVKYSRVASAERYLQNYEAADEAVSKAIEIHESLITQGKMARTNQQALATYLLARADLKVATQAFAEAEAVFKKHRQLCLELLETEPDSVLELNQLAEHHYQRAMMLVTQWLDSEFVPETARTSSEYLDIKQQIATCLQYFDQIEQTHGLDYHQQQYRASVKELREVVEQYLDEVLQASQAEEASSSQKAETSTAPKEK